MNVRILENESDIIALKKELAGAGPGSFFGIVIPGISAESGERIDLDSRDLDSGSREWRLSIRNNRGPTLSDIGNKCWAENVPLLSNGNGEEYISNPNNYSIWLKIDEICRVLSSLLRCSSVQAGGRKRRTKSKRTKSKRTKSKRTKSKRTKSKRTQGRRTKK